MIRNIPIGEVLKEKGYITDAQLSAALAFQKAEQGTNRRLGTVLIEKGFVSERQILSALCEKLNLHILPLETFPVDAEAVKRIPRNLASRYCLLAVAVNGSRLTVVMNDPLNFYAVEDVQRVTGMEIDVALSEKAKIEHAIDVYYSEIEAKQVAATMSDTLAPELTEMGSAAAEELENGDETPVIKLMNSLLLHGYNIGTSDIHIEPLETETRIRLRVDGMLIHYLTLARTLHPSLIARTKILANLDIAEKRLPQDGHFRVRVEGIEMNLRVSVVPTVYGEKAVLRYLNSHAEITHANQFGMNDSNYEKFKQMLQNPNGIIYLTGPTGSGKTTTLYLALEELVKRQVNISTIEDPVERHIHGVSQLQVNQVAGLTFESGLRSLLRQDPDILMVGETRDTETAEISVRSAITGHLVLSTLHTNDAISSIVRLEDMGIEPYLVANSLVGLVAQRLMRLTCPHCKETYSPNEQEIKQLGTDPGTLTRGKGCPACNNTGYHGRIAIHEVVAVDRAIRRMISDKMPIDDIYAYARETQKFTNLIEEAKELVLSGITTTGELTRLTYYVD